MELSDRARAILDLERSWWTEPGSKDRAIQARLAISSSRYYRILAELVDAPEAEAYDPLLVRRLRRTRVRRRRERFEGAPVTRGRRAGRPVR